MKQYAYYSGVKLTILETSASVLHFNVFIIFKE